MKLIILNKNLEKLDEFDYLKDIENIPKTYNNVPDINEDNKIIFNNMDYGIAIFSPTDDLNDFYITFLNNKNLEFTSYNNENIKGALVSDLFLAFNKNSVMLSKLKEVYTTNQSQHLYLEYYNNNFLFKRLNIKITRINSFIYILGKDETDYNIFSLKQNQFFEDYSEAIVIIQDNIIVKCNKKYLEIEYPKSYNDIINEEMDYNNLNIDLTKEIKKTIKNISEQKICSESLPLEIKKDNLTYYFNMNFSYIIYKNKPATMIIFNDITEKELNKKEIENNREEDLFLHENINFMQEITNTGLAYFYNNKFYYSSKLYELLELEPNSNEHRNLIKNAVIDEDKEFLNFNCKKFIENHERNDFIIRIRTAKNNLKYIHCYLMKNYRQNKSISLAYYKDVTDEQTYLNKLQQSLDETTKLRDNLNRIQSASKTFIGYKGLDYYKLTPEIYEILEINPNDYKIEENILDRLVIDEDYKLRQDTVNSLCPERPDVKFVQRIKTGKGNIKYIQTVIHEDYYNNGNFNGVSLNQDITEEIKYQKQLEKTLKDKQILLKEVHHRVKNNLQIILSLIDLNINFDTDVKNILQNTQNRIYAMALIHEKIYGSESLSAVNMKDYIESLVNSLIELYESNIKFKSNIDPIDLDMEESIPLGLIINEMVTNTIKYAFPDKKEGNLYIELKKGKTDYTLIFQDDGIGLPDNIDLDNPTSLGLIVITNLTLQIGGEITILNCKGTGYKIVFEED